MNWYLTKEELEAGLSELGSSPSDGGQLEMIVCRPSVDERLVLDQAELDQDSGLVGDSWLERGSKSTDDGRADPAAQVAIINSRIIDLLAGEKSRWALAGDQLYIDMDLSITNLPAGQRIKIGSAILEITDMAHTGCAKFTERFGPAAIRLVNSPEGRQSRWRGLYAKVIRSGLIQAGDKVRKIV